MRVRFVAAGARGGAVLRSALQPLLRERVAAHQARRLGRVRDVYRSLPEVSTAWPPQKRM